MKTNHGEKRLQHEFGGKLLEQFGTINSLWHEQFWQNLHNVFTKIIINVTLKSLVIYSGNSNDEFKPTVVLGQKYLYC